MGFIAVLGVSVSAVLAGELVALTVPCRILFQVDGRVSGAVGKPP
jgi:hypothetical protein